MKKVFLFLIVAVMSVTAMAQKKVAILETVDKTGEIGYAIKMMLRNSLTMAISNTPGYEGYDRVDMASITSEQEFQRTGLVSDDQIKKLGVATGASYVLVAEAAKYDADNIIITAKILDVETYGVKNVAMQTSGTSAAQMKKACSKLAEKLLNPESSSLQMEPTTSTRTTWIGIAIEGGKYTDNIYDYTIDTRTEEKYPVLGITLDLSFSFNKWYSLGPYCNAHTYFDNDGVYLGMLGGVMNKFTFKNNAAILLGLGGGYKFLKDEALAQVRFGFKLPNLMYFTFSFYSSYDEGIIEDTGLLVGLGFSFGGKKM